MQSTIDVEATRVAKVSARIAFRASRLFEERCPLDGKKLTDAKLNPGIQQKVLFSEDV